MFKLIIILVLTSQVISEPCTLEESVNITTGVSFTNGSVIHDGIEYVSGTWYHIDDDSEIRFGCPCMVRICLWKCCEENEAYINRSCLSDDSITAFNPPVYNGREPSNISAITQFYYFYNIGCDKYLLDSNSSSADMYLQENGTLYEISFGFHRWYPPSKFCLEMMTDSSAYRLVAGVCYPEEKPATEDDNILHVAYAVGLILSVPFLLATFVVYAFIPELRNVHGLCLMAYTGGLIVAYSFLAYLRLHQGTVGVGMTGCYVTAFIVYFAFQTSFCWLNVMCFDIWRTFSGYRGSTNKKKDVKRFAIYGVYAWGVPVILTIITTYMQFSESLPESIVRPGFGSTRCWFVDWLSELLYFFIPVLILVVCNVILFTVTAYRIRAIRQETAILKGSESSRSDRLKKDKQRYSLYLKLFLVMGVNWTAEVISFTVSGSNWYWIVPDFANIALGIYIFFVFVWKKKIRNLAVKRWRSIRGMQATESGVGRWATRSSAATEDTRVSADESGVRLRDMH